MTKVLFLLTGFLFSLLVLNEKNLSKRWTTIAQSVQSIFSASIGEANTKKAVTVHLSHACSMTYAQHDFLKEKSCLTYLLRQHLGELMWVIWYASAKW